MRVIVCGGRDFTDHEYINDCLRDFDEDGIITTLIHGDARGVDRIAAKWAYSNDIEVIPYPADWKRHGNAAGPIRNTLMLKEERPDAVIAFPGGSGTEHMVKISRKAGVDVYEYDPDAYNLSDYFSS